MSESVPAGRSASNQDTLLSVDNNVISTQQSPSQGRHARALAPRPPTADASNEPAGTKQKQSKSRNGCVTCKAKRMKCDETKPTCQQCARRKVVCGGYKKNIRWKPFGQSKTFTTDPPNDEPSIPGESSSSAAKRASPQRRATYPILSNNLSEDSSGLQEPEAPDAPQPTGNLSFNQAPDFSPRDADGDLPFSMFDIDEFLQSHSSADLADLFSGTGLHASMPGHLDWQIDEPYGSFRSRAAVPPVGFTPPADVDDQAPFPSRFYGLSEAWMASIEPSPPSSELQNNGDDRSLVSQQTSELLDPETLEHLFEHETCRILSIAHEPANNPWRTLIWPLARDCPALYHAIAAMTCLHLAKAQPQLHDEGVQHMQSSRLALASDAQGINRRLDATIATMLALGFAETWDTSKASNGLEYISNAQGLVVQALTIQQSSGFPAEDNERLNFLINTWIYMDVITRLTSLDTIPPGNTEIITTCGGLHTSPTLEDIDPLMGYGATLFPIIGRTADLIGRVRKRIAKRISPAILSQAMTLKRELEDWMPPVELDSAENVTYNMSETIQTAEAYRWATLLLLRQAVPELPSLQSWDDISQKVLLFLATIPVTSRTTIVQVYPLMVAGCEASEEEDKEWVRDRWELMSKRMMTGIVDRCLEITIEVWRRRDECAAPCELCGLMIVRPTSSGTSLSDGRSRFNSSTPPGFNSVTNTIQHDNDVPMVNSGGREPFCKCIAKLQASLGTYDFPESAAFKRGAEPLTRAGCMDYTVRGKCHWMGVMKDWNWEVMLG